MERAGEREISKRARKTDREKEREKWKVNTKMQRAKFNR